MTISKGSGIGPGEFLVYPIVLHADWEPICQRTPWLYKLNHPFHLRHPKTFSDSISTARTSKLLKLRFLPQVTSAYVSPCILNMVPDDVDLVLVEFTFNDSVATYLPQLEEKST